MAEEKTFLPIQVLSFLRYELDSVKMEVRLPFEKLQKCLSHIQECLTKPKLTLKTLQNIIGTLNLCSGTSRMSLPKATDWLDNWGVKASLFHLYYKGSAGRPAHVGRIPCQLQREDHLHSRAMIVVKQPEPVHRRLWNPWLWGSAGLILVLRSMVSAVGQSKHNTAGALPHCPGCADMRQQASQWAHHILHRQPNISAHH